MRRGIDGLVEIVQQTFKLDPFEDRIFLFCGRKQDSLLLSCKIYENWNIFLNTYVLSYSFTLRRINNTKFKRSE